MAQQKTTLSDLRDQLFDVLQRVKDGGDPDCEPKDTIPLENAKVITSIASNIIDSAKVEVDAIKILANAENLDVNKLLGNAGLTQIPEKVPEGRE